MLCSTNSFPARDGLSLCRGGHGSKTSPERTITDLVAETLGSNDGDLIADALVGLKVQGELGVVSLNDDLGGLLDGLGTNATHFGGIGRTGAVVGRGKRLVMVVVVKVK